MARSTPRWYVGAVHTESDGLMSLSHPWRLVGACLLVVMSRNAHATDTTDTAPQLDRETALWLAALPLSCIDKLHDAPKSRGYLYETTLTLRADFAKTRAFYGCSDWHSAVNSTWMMVKLLRAFPDLRVARLIREKLNEHLSPSAIGGEVAFFTEDQDKSFERPYGYAWLLRLYGELRSWDDPDARKWATTVAPLARLLLERTTAYLQTLAEPMRVGTHANTAFALQLLLEFARSSGDQPLETAVRERATAFYRDDVGCAPNVEVSGSDFFSPCLLEAALMGQVLPQGEFSRWLSAFLPAPTSPGFQALTVVVEMKGNNQDLVKSGMIGAKAHLIGLAVSRAKSLEDIAGALAPSDSRVAEYRRIATRQGRSGMAAMYNADYVGTHWIGTYLLDYMVTAASGRKGKRV